MTRPDKPGIWALFEGNNAIPNVFLVQVKEDWGPGNWVYVGAIPERPSPPTDKEIADAAKNYIMLNNDINAHYSIRENAWNDFQKLILRSLT